MGSEFCGRFDFLMRVAGIKNSVLARALNFDPSYISRIRSGKRGMPVQHDFIKRAAHVFAGNITSDLQRSLIVSAIGWEKAPLDASEMEAGISAWLSNSSPSDCGGRRGALYSAEGSQADDEEIRGTARNHVDGGCAMLFYGDDGKREAVSMFLSDLLERGRPATLLLYSDEDMHWLTGNAAFAERWLDLLLRLLDAGSTIKIVHTVSRDIGNMLEGLRK